MHGPIDRYDYSLSSTVTTDQMKVLYLDYNEYHGEIHPETLRAFKSAEDLLTSYYRPGAKTLEQKLAHSLGAPKDHLYLVSGADQALEEIIGYCRYHLNLSSFFSFHQTTYDHFYTFARKYSLSEASFSEAELIYVCCPNNPDGLMTTPLECKKLASEHPEKMFIFDLSYLKYSSHDYESYFGSLHALPNVFMLSSLAKMYPLAGLRSGWVHTSSEKAKQFFDAFLNAKLTNPISRRVLDSCLDHKSFYDQEARDIFNNRKSLAEVLLKAFHTQNLESHLLSDLGLQGGNFFSLKFGKKEDLPLAISYLGRAGIQIRHKAHWDFIRVTSVNNAVLREIQERLLC